MSAEKTYKGSCFCGAVKLTVKGEPMLMGYCHCGSCRHWAAAPITAFTLWSPDAVSIDEGADNLHTFAKTPDSRRKSCRSCGGHVLTDSPGQGFTDVYPAVVPDLPFEPAVHVHYGESVLAMKDGLPKFKDLPGDAGGSGETVSE